MSHNVDRETEMRNQRIDSSMETSQNHENIKKKLEELKEQARLLKKQIPKKAKRQTLPQSIKDEEFSKLLSTMKNNKKDREAKIAFLLAYEAGLRISEIKHLLKQDIDVASKRIYVKQGKYSKDRVVPLPKTWRSYMMDFIPIKKSVRSLERNLKTAIRKAGLRGDLHFHSLRHSFATHCLERGMPINQLQVLMGHSNISTTNVYIRANPEDALSTYNKNF